MNDLVLKLKFNWKKSMYKIWQILKHLSRASSWAQTSSFRSVFMERKIQSQYNQFSLERCSVYLATFSYWRSKIGFGSNYIDDEELPRYSKTNFQYAIAWYTLGKKNLLIKDYVDVELSSKNIPIILARYWSNRCVFLFLLHPKIFIFYIFLTNFEHCRISEKISSSLLQNILVYYYLLLIAPRRCHGLNESWIRIIFFKFLQNICFSNGKIDKILIVFNPHSGNIRHITNLSCIDTSTLLCKLSVVSIYIYMIQEVRTYRLFKISLSMVAWRSSLDELTLEGCEAVGESNEVTVGNGDNGKGLNGEPAAAAAKAAGEWAQAYGEWTSVGGVGKPIEW